MSNSFIDPSLLGPAGSSSAAPSSAPVPPAGAAPGGQSAPPAQQPQASTSAVSAEAAEAAKKADEAKKAEERARKDRTLVEFMQMLDGYDPVIPEEVTSYYLQKAGFESTDPRLTRLLSLTTQKFLSDISKDAFHYARIRTNAQPQGRGRPAAAGLKDKNKTVLTMDDLSASLAERGVNVKKPEYFQ